MKYYIQHKMMCMWSYLLLLSTMLTRYEAEYSSKLKFAVCTLYSSCLILLLNIFLYESMYVYTKRIKQLFHEKSVLELQTETLWLCILQTTLPLKLDCSGCGYRCVCITAWHYTTWKQKYEWKKFWTSL